MVIIRGGTSSAASLYIPAVFGVFNSRSLINKTVQHDSTPKLGVAISRIGASKAILLGAHAFAINKI